MTQEFVLDDIAIRLKRENISIPYSEIDWTEIFEGVKISKKKFMIVFFVVWLGGVAVLLYLQGGDPIRFFGIFDASSFTTLLLLAGLGLLAANPIYNMFPHGTFLRVRYKGRTVDLEITELTSDDRIHTLISTLKAAVGVSKIKIKK